MKSWILITIVCLALAGPKEDDLIDYLPGFPDRDDRNFDMFSGFLDIAGGKHIHYMFVESQFNFEVDPVIIWFNGGPGCSSMLGFATEHGPYLMKDGETSFSKEPNPWSWNNNANVLYIESPVGVGYSWIEGGYDPKPEIDDKETAVDALAAIK